eukprot:410179-Rhodomonas_salina.1
MVCRLSTSRFSHSSSLELRSRPSSQRRTRVSAAKSALSVSPEIQSTCCNAQVKRCATAAKHCVTTNRAAWLYQELERKVPCQRAEGAWAHICLASVSVSCKSVAVALEMSRHLPDHILHFLVTVAHLENSEASRVPYPPTPTPPILTSRMVLPGGGPRRRTDCRSSARVLHMHPYGPRPLLVLRGESVCGRLGLLLMGRALYMPLLFYLPAILVGYASAKPLESYLETSIGSVSYTHLTLPTICSV